MGQHIQSCFLYAKDEALVMEFASEILPLWFHSCQ